MDVSHNGTTQSTTDIDIDPHFIPRSFLFSFADFFHEPVNLEDGPCLISDLNVFLTQPIEITYE